MTINGLIVDLFAGAGGASLGMEMALGRPVDVAINHNPEAVAAHKANHPNTRHLIQNIYKVRPEDATLGQPVAALWASPDCRHFSKAKGGKPVSKSVRDLAWAVTNWARKTKPKLISVENVKEFLTWGPLDSKGKPIKELAGETFERWVKSLEAEGFRVDWRLLKACDFGAPTIRERLIIAARRDGKPIVWPEPTHGPGRPKPWRTAAEIIDWSLPVPSIFDRKKPLAENTHRRIAEGLRRYVLAAQEPFIVPGAEEAASWILQANTGVIGRPADWPLSTVLQTGSHQQLATATLIQTGYGERPGQSPRVPGLGKPMGTVVAGGIKHALVLAALAPSPLQNHKALVSAFIAKPNHTADYYKCFRGQSLAEPLQTVTQHHGFGLVTAYLSHFYHTFQDGSLFLPHKTITAGGRHSGLVTAFLTKYFGTALAEPLSHPASTLCGRPKLALTSAFLIKYFGTGVSRDLRTPLGAVTTRDRFGKTRISLSEVDLSAQESSPLILPDPDGRLSRTFAFMTRYLPASFWHNLKTSQVIVGTEDITGLISLWRVPLVWIKGQAFLVVDIHLRMLTPRELARAQGFPDGYILAPIYLRKPLTQEAQVSNIGNAVPPVLAERVVGSNRDAVDYQPRVRHRPMPLFETEGTTWGNC